MSDVVERGKAALEGVTDGPWRWDDDDDLIAADPHARPVITVNCYNESVNVENPRDSQFIAQARSLVPELIAEVERLRAQETRIRELCAETEDEKWRRKIARAFDGSTSPHMVRADDVLAALDTEGEQ
ncbi:hypothetical protein I5H32_gp087 [Mycobacterium phage EleanorGeorge]|uniref:Uncharacterized protein n=1 Tax=Mycobacterium phage EleanorGeorge TaxID=2301563 RepID=A0A385DPK3_9CAUD|nr:hypothetical protein I5H32_gp087 [Mycobacterium phage EleanorGeorge]AXQ60787.1 hypothetical protein SEA_ELEANORGEORGE_87 [Mycobacterium phage EleanorGeorge]